MINSKLIKGFAEEVKPLPSQYCKLNYLIIYRVNYGVIDLLGYVDVIINEKEVSCMGKIYNLYYFLRFFSNATKEYYISYKKYHFVAFKKKQ